jgi:hypothetical protein
VCTHLGRRIGVPAMAYSPLKRARSSGADGAGEGDVRTSYTSEFLESVDDLPVELRKCYSLIKDLDEYVHEMVDGRPSPETPGVEEMKKVMLNKARRINESGKGSMDKSGQALLKKQWKALQEAQKKVLEIATEKVQLAEQAQRHVQNHMVRLDELHHKFEKELHKSDPEGLAEVLGQETASPTAQSKAPPPARKKKQPVKFDLVGKWIAIEYDDEAAKAERPNDPVEKVWYNGLVMAYDDNLHSYLISWEVGGEEWIDDLKEDEYTVVPAPA